MKIYFCCFYLLTDYLKDFWKKSQSTCDIMFFLTFVNFSISLKIRAINFTIKRRQTKESFKKFISKVETFIMISNLKLLHAKL